MKQLIPILCVTLSLTACSGPDSSGGVALSKDPYLTNQEFPHGDCDDDPTFGETNTGCGWIHVNDQSFYIKPGADLRGASLAGADLRDAELEGAILDSAYMPHVNLRYANLMGATLTGATLSHANLSHANLRYASLREAKLTRAILWGVDGLRANLTGADLIAASLRNAKMGAARFSLANLSGADLRGAWFSGEDIVTPTPTNYFRDVKANSSTICPNGKKWGTPGNNCGF
jgi:uncharacterized protein YjbI with pentapeptide repeats